MLLSDVRELEFQRVGLFSRFWTVIWVLLTGWLLWEIYRVVTGPLPLLDGVLSALAIVYMWYLRLAPVVSVTVAGDGRVTFIRGWGRREVDALDVKSVRPWLGISKKYFVLSHAHGYELLFEDPAQVARLSRELKKLNPEIAVRGVAQLPGEVASG